MAQQRSSSLPFLSSSNGCSMHAFWSIPLSESICMMESYRFSPLVWPWRHVGRQTSSQNLFFFIKSNTCSQLCVVCWFIHRKWDELCFFYAIRISVRLPAQEYDGDIWFIFSFTSSFCFLSGMSTMKLFLRCFFVCTMQQSSRNTTKEKKQVVQVSSN